MRYLFSALLVIPCLLGLYVGDAASNDTWAAELSGGNHLQDHDDALASPTSAQITVSATSAIAHISAAEIGTNIATFYNVTASTLPAELARLGAHLIRWPGGSVADTYHWHSHTECTAPGKLSPAYDPGSTFDHFMSDVIGPGSYDAAITVNYGSNAACTGGGEPAEAAGWVAYAKAKGYGSRIRYWTVGNEEFGNWEFDLHAPAHDPTAYARAMSGNDGYYRLMKAQDPAAQIGIVVFGSSGYSDWDRVVLSSAPYDFVELHWYAQQPKSENDAYLLQQAPGSLSSAIAALRGELRSIGRGNTPIMLGEFNSVAYNPGKQTLSVVNALFTGMAFGEVLNSNLAAATWWFGAGGNQNCGNNNSNSLYGWQQFGGYDLVAANSAYSWNYCTNNNGQRIIPEGTLLPSGEAFALVSEFATPGNSMLSTTVSATLPDVRVYAATQGNGYALMLFNLNATTSRTTDIAIVGAPKRAYRISKIVYGKAQYDNSQNNNWSSAIKISSGSTPLAASIVVLPPWSMTVLKFQ